MDLSGANFKYHSKTSHSPHPFAPVSSIYHSIKNTWRERRNFILKMSPVAGVGTAVLGFSTISCLAFDFDKNNLGGEERKPEIFWSVTFKVTGLLWIKSLSNLAYNEGFHLNSG